MDILTGNEWLVNGNLRDIVYDKDSFALARVNWFDDPLVVLFNVLMC